jgi:hypothetical protein
MKNEKIYDQNDYITKNVLGHVVEFNRGTWAWGRNVSMEYCNVASTLVVSIKEKRFSFILLTCSFWYVHAVLHVQEHVVMFFILT